MIRSWLGAVLAVWLLGGLFAGGAVAHPASGIVVDARGDVYFVYTGRGLCKIGPAGKLTFIHHDTGGHWLALDADGRFSAQFPRLFKQITPEDGRPALLYASGGGPLVVGRDGNLY